MLIPRVIPCLLIENGAMVKTRRFQKRTYLGDPINVINLFNQFEADEIVLLDISASAAGRAPDVELIESIADECWVPLAYGGGISSLAHIESIIRAGVEKVIIGTAAAEQPRLISSAAQHFGSQAIVASVDAKRCFFGGYETRIRGGRRRLCDDPATYAKRMEDLGAGEILLQSIDRDGEMSGYDLDLIGSVTSVVSIPVIACGGASSRSDLVRPIHEASASAVAAGSLFVFSGLERGVLINFPERAYLERLFRGSSSYET
jgi:imidazole glycerol-phosphate synthase subunit HisF